MDRPISTSLFDPTPEHRDLRRMLRSFVEREVEVQAAEHDRLERFNRPLFERLGAELGVLGLTIDERFGGAAMDATASVIVHEELSASDPGLALAYLAHSVLFVNNLYQNGDESQRSRYLPDACSGKTVCGMCMSEPDAGTDVLAMTTTAARRGDEYRLRGTKMWITNGSVGDGPGDAFLVYARPEGGRRDELSLFIVESSFEGFSVGQRLHGKLGMRASGTAELVFDDCVVPAGNRVGAEGQALAHMMQNLEIERLTLAAISLGIARRSIEVMNRYASERQAFGQPLHRFGQIQRHVANSYAEWMAGRSYVYATAAGLRLEQHGQRLDSDGCKLYCSTMAKNVADRAIQVLGGYGYLDENPVARLWRDAKLLEIGGGTLEAHQKNMTRDLSRLGKFD